MLEHQPKHCLELGFAHGVSSCYIAAALEEVGRGSLTSVDLESSKEREPSIEDLLRRMGLEKRVTVIREKTGYNWFLKKKIEESTTENRCKPIYDFCFIDGAKNWTIDGFAFFLVDKLLRQEGWIQFDDYSWTYAEQATRTGKKVTDGVHHRELSKEELEDPHIEAIFRLLVMAHPDYSNFKVLDNKLAYAQKVKSDVKKVKLETGVSYKYKLTRGLKRVREFLGRE